MSAAKLLNTDAAKWAAVAAVAAVALYFIGRKVAGAIPGAASAVGQAINPVNPDNIFAGSVNAVGGALSGQDDWSLGSWVYDVTHEEYDPNAPAQAARRADTAAQGREAGFHDSWSLGSWLYDLTHEEYDPNAPEPKTKAADNYLSGAIDWIWPDPK